MSIEIIKEGIKYWGDSYFDGGRNYMILKSNENLNKEMVKEFLENGYMDDLEGYSSSIPGGRFVGSAWIRVHGKKAIVTQRFGWDV